MTCLFVIGGARSGKSRYAQARAEALSLKPLYVATAQAFDDEMRDRIACHRADRGPAWETIEAPLDIAETIAARSQSDRVILVDCLTLWVTNLILEARDVEAETRALIASLASATGPSILVANEVGLGIVPDNPLARRFRDEAGIVNQRVAEAATEVQLMAAGLNVRLK